MILSIKSFSSKSIGLYEKIFFFIIVLYTGGSTPYTQVLLYPIREHLFFQVIPIVLITILLFRNRINFYRLLFPLTVLFVWIGFQYFKYGTVFPMTLFYVYNLLLAFIIASVYKKNVFFLYEESVTILSIIGLIVWFLFLIAPDDVFSMMSPFNMISHSDTLNVSVILATISGSSDFLGSRNCGFSQEPGLYASLLCVAIYANLIRNKFELKKNYNLYILLVSLITTQSTTGYIAFLFIIYFYVLNKRGISKLINLVLFIIVVPTIISLPFIGTKINEYWYQDDSKENAARNVEMSENGQVYVPQRIDAIVFDAINLTKDPILGYGVEDDNSYISKDVSKNIVLSEGIVNIFARFGVLFGAIFLYFIYRTSRDLSRIFNYKGKLFLLAIWASISVSYDFNRYPLLLSMWLFTVFIDANYFFKLEKTKKVLIHYFTQKGKNNIIHK